MSGMNLTPYPNTLDTLPIKASFIHHIHRNFNFYHPLEKLPISD